MYVSVIPGVNFLLSCVNFYSELLRYFFFILFYVLGEISLIFYAIRECEVCEGGFVCAKVCHRVYVYRFLPVHYGGWVIEEIYTTAAATQLVLRLLSVEPLVYFRPRVAVVLKVFLNVEGGRCELLIMRVSVSLLYFLTYITCLTTEPLNFTRDGRV